MNGEETRYLLDVMQLYAQVREEYAPDGTDKVSYVYGNDLIKQTRGNDTTSYHMDGLGSTRVLTDTQGQIVAAYNFDAYGELINSTGTVSNNYLFAGEQYDANLGDYYLRQRSYSPGAGRFGRRDTWEGLLGNPITLHKYGYGNGNPVFYVDPSGYSSLTWVTASSTMLGILAASIPVGINAIMVGATVPGLGGFCEDSKPRSALDGLMAWRSIWAPSPLGGFDGTPPNVRMHTGHTNSYEDFVAFVFTYDTVELRANLAADGRPVPKGYAAHHIVAGGLGWFQEARDMFTSKGIGINDADNGAVLANGNSTPSSHQWPGRHTRATADKIILRIRRLSDSEARDEMTRIGQEMENGTFDLN